jgi:hypothetical protein
MALPTLAAGAEVRLGPAHPCDVRFCVASQEITYTAASGERNAVRLTADPSGAVVIVDTGAAITVGPADASAVGARCTVSDDGHQARCTPVLPPVVSVAVGDADDTASIGVRGSIDGGPGDDVLDASADAVVLRGGAGSDRLTGGDGAQTLDGGPGPDTIAGGPGIDTATYADRGAPVHAALDGNPTSGEAGEGDAISPDVENLVGGSAADDLVGSPADNERSRAPGRSPRRRRLRHRPGHRRSRDRRPAQLRAPPNPTGVR